MTITPLIAVVLALVALGGAAVVLTREPRQQAIMASFYGLLLVVLFFVLQAPDVALSELAVGMVAVPLMILLALSKTQRRAE